MKKVLLFLLICWVQQSFSQQADTTLKFNKRYTECEKKWVIISKADTAKTYIYIDQQAGFTFDLQGAFAVDKYGKYIKDTTSFKNAGSIKYRIAPNWRPLALLPVKHFKELKLLDEPTWIKNYYRYTDTAYFNYRMGWVYNDANESDIALTYLKKAYQVKPHKVDVEFEMAYAYNVLQHYNDAIAILKPVINDNPTNVLLNKELGYAYLKLKEYDEALNVYLNTYNLFPDAKSEAKGEVALNMASIYQQQGKTQVYKIWMMKAKKYTPESSSFYKRIIDAGF